MKLLHKGETCYKRNYTIEKHGILPREIRIAREQAYRWEVRKLLKQYRKFLASSSSSFYIDKSINGHVAHFDRKGITVGCCYFCTEDIETISKFLKL